MRTPALAAWRREIATRERSNTTFDALWSAACSEITAFEAETIQLPRIAASYRRDAREIIRRAVREAAR